MGATREDQETADKFATSWNTVYEASVYTREQFVDWIAPWRLDDLRDQEILELGCGSGALLYHMAGAGPARLVGLDLGASVDRASQLLADGRAEIAQADLTDPDSIQQRFGSFDRVYCIGVLHHLTVPEKGIESLLRLTRPGGAFHGWVYGHEGNALVRWVVDPIRRLAHRLPWWVNKYFVALPLSVPFFVYSKLCRGLHALGLAPPLPLFDYMLWISKRGFRFHHHVAFDQLVTPMTHYIKRSRVESWLDDERVDPSTTYITFRNGNGWTFGGKIRS